MKNSVKNIFLKFLSIFSRTGISQWRDVEYFDEDWKQRIALMATLITNEKSLFDLGCGKQWLKNFLPATCLSYHPVDYTPRSQDTIICDFNKKEFPDFNADLAFISGCLEYIYEYKWFIGAIAAHCRYAIISYCSIDKFPDLQIRRKLFWVNNLSKEELLNEFSRNNMRLDIDMRYEKFEILKFISYNT